MASKAAVKTEATSSEKPQRKKFYQIYKNSPFGKTSTTIILILGIILFGGIAAVTTVIVSSHFGDLRAKDDANAFLQGLAGGIEQEVDEDGLIRLSELDNEMRTLNPDYVCWIRIGGTSIDYPVVTTISADHYLETDFFGNRSARGTLFTDIRNDPDWEDPFIVIYGHNMKDGSMFADLRKFRNKDFFSENRRIIIYTPEGQLEYRIIAAYERDNEHIMGTRNFRNPRVMREHLASLLDIDSAGAIFEIDNVTDTDSLLVLSTCTWSEEKRFIVQAVFLPPADLHSS